jgi:hypothetical protein
MDNPRPDDESECEPRLLRDLVLAAEVQFSRFRPAGRDD